MNEEESLIPNSKRKLSTSAVNNGIIQHDAFLSFLFRTQLRNYHFLQLWSIMHRLGWKYDSSNVSYVTPCGLSLGSAKESVETMDLFALKPMHDYASDHQQITGNDIIIQRIVQIYRRSMSSSQSSQTKSFINEIGENHVDSMQNSLFVDRIKLARKQILEKLFYRYYQGTVDDNVEHNDEMAPKLFELHDKSGHNEKAKSNNSNDNRNFHVTTDRVNFIKEYSVKSRLKRKINTTVTANEPGTEQYFSKFETRKSLRRNNQSMTRKNNPTITKSGSSKSLSKTNQDKNDVLQQQLCDDFLVGLETNTTKITLTPAKECVNEFNIKAGNSLVQMKYCTINSFSSFYPEWHSILSTNHSLLLHGFGSKRDLLNNFAKNTLSLYGDVITLDGFDPTISVSQVLDLFVNLFLNGSEPTSSSIASSSRYYNTSSNSNLFHRAINISHAISHQSRNHPPIYVIIHNIDGLAFRSDHAQHALAVLVSESGIGKTKAVKSFDDSHTAQGTYDDVDYLESQIIDQVKDSLGDHNWDEKEREEDGLRNIRLIASVDNVDVLSVLWNVDTSHRFSWIWKTTNTFIPYTDEVHSCISNDEGPKVKTAKQQVVDYSFMQRVLQNLAPRHTDVLKLLAELQIQSIEASSNTNNKKDSSNINDINQSLAMNNNKLSYVDYAAWKSLCMKKMAVSKESELQSMMKELVDHGMIVMNKKVYGVSSGANLLLCIPSTINHLKGMFKK